MKGSKDKLMEVIETLNENQAEYLLHLVQALFRQAPN